MAGIVYPNGIDTFNEPSLPETTPLSEAGTGTRNHVQHHHDLGLAITALQQKAAFREHDHSGDSTDTSKGAKLSWKNTHETATAYTTLAAAQAVADTDDSVNAIHHTIGTGAFQAAAGNHTHDYNGSTILNRPFVICTSNPASYPSSPAKGTMIYESDTNRVRVWANFTNPASTPTAWQILPVGSIPACRLRQNQAQKLITASGTRIEWHEELEDNFDFIQIGTSTASKTDIIIKEAGLYSVEAAIQWDTSWVPDVAKIALWIGNSPTSIQQSQYLRGNIFSPGFSQTLYCSGKLRFSANDVLRVIASYTENNNIIDKIFSYFDYSSQVKSRIDINFIGP